MSGSLFTVGLIAAWYSSNIGVLLLNRYLLSNYGFRYPIFLTMCHMTACALLSYVAIAWLKIVPTQAIRSQTQFMKIAASSVIFCTSVVSGNISLRLLPVSFNQAVGATTPFFTAVFAYFLTLRRQDWLVYGALIPVVTSVMIASGGEPSFHLYGFAMCIMATAARALKSVVQGILLSSEGEKLNSMNLLLYMAPIALVVLVPATLLLEPNVAGITVALARKDVLMLLLMFVNSTMAYIVNLTNFLVTKHISALTLQVLGNAKGAVAVVVSILLFRNPISVVGMVGYSLTVFGVFLYSEAKRRCKWSSCVLGDIILSFYFVCCCCSRCMQSSCCCCLIRMSLSVLYPLSFPQFTETSIWLFLRWKNQSVSFLHWKQTCLLMVGQVFLRWKNQSMIFRHQWQTCLRMMWHVFLRRKEPEYEF